MLAQVPIDLFLRIWVPFLNMYERLFIINCDSNASLAFQDSKVGLNIILHIFNCPGSTNLAADNLTFILIIS